MKKGLILSIFCLLFANIKAQAQNSCEVYIGTKEQLRDEFYRVDMERVLDDEIFLLFRKVRITAEEAELKHAMIQSALEDPAIGHRILTMRKIAHRDNGPLQNEDLWVKALMAVHNTTGLKTISDFKFAEALIRALNANILSKADQLEAIAERRRDDGKYRRDMDALAEFYVTAYRNEDAGWVFEANIQGRKNSRPLEYQELMAELEAKNSEREIRKALSYIVNKFDVTEAGDAGEAALNKILQAGVGDPKIKEQVILLGEYAKEVWTNVGWLTNILKFHKNNALNTLSDFRFLRTIIQLRSHWSRLDFLDSLLKIRSRNKEVANQIDNVTEAFLETHGTVDAARLAEDHFKAIVESQ